MLSLEIAFTGACVWLIVMPHRYASFMDRWRREFGGVHVRSDMPLWLVRVAGFVLLFVFWLVVFPSRR